MSQRGDSRRSSAVSGPREGSQRSATASSRGRDASPSRQSTTSSSPRTARGRHNKIYRTPPTPPPGEMLHMEKGFILDSRAVSSISCDYSKTNPKLGPVIPPYNSQKDYHTTHYYTFHGVDRTLKKTGQHPDSVALKPNEVAYCSIEGPVMDRFYNHGAGYQYLTLRNQFGAGHSRQQVDGHSQFMKGVKPITGYNGKYGFRRNTPWLRQMPSPFGTTTLSSTY